MMKFAVIAVALLASCAQGQASVTIQTVHVGNVGNVDDTRFVNGDFVGAGGVDYPYEIGKFEVTAGQYTEFLNAVAGIDSTGLYDQNMWSNTYGCKIERFAGTGTSANPYQYRVSNDCANRPANFIDFWDAARFANWMHNGQGNGDTEVGSYINVGDQTNFTRLPSATWVIPTEDEWYKAAYHKNDGQTANYYSFSTGNDVLPGRDLDDTSGNNANYWSYGSVFPIDSPHYMTMVGEFQNSPSPYGTFDQGGNVAEWNEAVIGNSYRSLRGGMFDDVGVYMAASFRSFYTIPTLRDYAAGFRLAYVPAPATIALLALGAIRLAARRRR